MATRHHKAFSILPEMVVEFLRGNEKSYTNDIPLDAELIDIRYNRFSGAVEFIVATQFGEDAESGQLVRIDVPRYFFRPEKDDPAF